MKKTKEEIIEYINTLDGYEGYIQYSNRKIDKDTDIFTDKNPHANNENGFVYEAHFYNSGKSIAIKQINDSWLVSKTDISNIDENDIQTYKSDIQDWNYNIKMAQIWEEVEDSLCAAMKVKKLKKVVFTGFEKGDSK